MFLSILPWGYFARDLADMGYLDSNPAPWLKEGSDPETLFAAPLNFSI
jgi:hypothetical protein